MDVYAIVPIRTIPRTTSGKIQRYLLAERWQAGEWADVMQELAELDGMEQPAPAIGGASTRSIEIQDAAGDAERFEELLEEWEEEGA